MNFSHRRQRLFKQLPNNSVALIPAARVRFRNADTEYAFRQDSHYQYFSGHSEPEGMLIFVKNKQGKSQLHVLVQPKDPKMEVWTGVRLGVEGAKAFFDTDYVYVNTECEKQITQLFAEVNAIYWPMHQCSELDQKIMHWSKLAKQQAKRDQSCMPRTLVDLNPIISEMRLIKDSDEITAMRQASQITAQAHCVLMQRCKPGMNELELASEFEYQCTKAGCSRLAYPSIVASGHNACILHYVDNNQTLKAGDLVLIDAGGEYNYYAADITRTFPINGRFNEVQKLLYEVVLAAQIAAIEVAKPGHSYEEIHKVAVQKLVEGLVDLKILSGAVNKLVADKAYQPFYMHNTGHWLGLDVHDTGAYRDQNGSYRNLEPGMAFTIEPGLYISHNAKEVDPKWHGIGIRIEDNILITESGNEVMTQAVPKQVSEIEALMA